MSEDESIEGETEPSESEIKNPLGLYEGDRSASGERHGRGKALLPNGDMYVGGYCRGQRHGRGSYVFAGSGARYEGNWRHNLRHGRGTFHYPDGTSYEGEWRHDRRNGFGAYRYRNGDVYEGSWKHGQRHGLGTYNYAGDGSRYYGTWIADRMQGAGQLVHQRHRFHGFWDINLPTGRGCFIFENGCMQHGYYALMHDPDYSNIRSDASSAKQASEVEAEEGTTKSEDSEVQKVEDKDLIIPTALKEGTITVWRARCVTAYNPDMLPPEPMPLREVASEESLSNVCEDEDPSAGAEEYLKRDDYDLFVGEAEEEYEESLTDEHQP